MPVSFPGYPLLRAALFQLEAERAHDLTLDALRVLWRTGLAARMRRNIPARPLRCMGLEFPNPVGLAAGFDKNGDYIEPLASLGFGFLEVGTVTPRPQAGNPAPRLFRLTAQRAIINRMGFNNKGIAHLVERLKARTFTGVLGVNIGKNRDTPQERAVEDYLCCLEAVYPYADYIVVNVSSPNTTGLRDLQRGEPLKKLLSALDGKRVSLRRARAREVPLLVKIAPDLDEAAIATLCAVVADTDFAGVIATNTTLDRSAIRDDPLAGQAGGLSGAPLLTRANRVQQQVREHLHGDQAVIGCGGITRGSDAALKRRCGADLVQLYSGLVYRGPGLVADAVRAWEASAA